MEITKYNETTVLNSGVFVDVPGRVYREIEGVSKTTLHTINKSPAHLKLPREKGDIRKIELINALKCALFTPVKFKEEFMLLPECKDRRSAEYKSAVRTLGTDKVLVGQEVESILKSVDSITANDATQIITEHNGVTDAVITAIDPVTSQRCFCRVDLLADGVAYIIKRVNSATTEEFSNMIARGRYHVDAAFISDVIRWATGEMIKVKFVAVEDRPPYSSALFSLDDGTVALGRDGVNVDGLRGYRQNLDLYAECIINDTWNGYENSGVEQVVSLPNYLLNKFENELEDDIL